MKFVVSGLARLALRAPWLVVVASLALTGVFGYYSTHIEVASGNEGFAPEGAEISASERISEKFGEESSESILQVLVRDDGGDVITVEGLRVATRVVELTREELGEQIADRADRPGVFHYLSIVSQAMEAQGLAIEAMTDEMVKAIYIEAIDGDGESDAPPEQVSFLTRLVSEDFDPQTVTASGGMVLAFVSPFEGPDADTALQSQVDAESALADRLSGIDTDLEIRPFSFPLLLTGVDDFTEEVGRLFGIAFAVILLILLYVYWIRPTGSGTRWPSLRRTVADTLLTLLTIVMAIGWMQGIGYLLERAGVIDAFSAPTQIVPILLIGLGVDYAIHLISRDREEVGEGLSVDRAMTAAITTVGVALALATVTTVIGFLTNLFNPVPALKDFGLLAALGILVSFLLMLTFVPAVRLLADRRAERVGALPVRSLESHADRLLPRAMEKLALLAEHAAIPTLIVAVLLGLAGFWGFTQLETRFSFTDFLPEDSPYVETLGVLESEFGGGFGEQTQVLVEATPEQEIDAGVHNALVAANASLVDSPDVSTISTPQGEFANAVSPLSLLGQMMASPDGLPPQMAEAAAATSLQPDLTVAADSDIRPLYRALLENAPDQGGRVIHFEGDRLDALLWDITTTAGENVGPLREFLDEAFLPVSQMGASAIDTSQNIIGDVVVTSLTQSQSASLFITIAVAGVVLIISFYLESRRWMLGLITIAPVALVVLWTYGLMFATGIPFGPVTATLAALAIGIGVPFTIHIARRFQEDRAATVGMDEAMRSTMRHTGGALAGSAFTTMAGFGVLMTSSLVPFRQMGQVTVYAIGLSLVAAVLVLPSMLALWDRYHRRRGDVAIGSELRDDITKR